MEDLSLALLCFSKTNLGPGCGSTIEHMPYLCEALVQYTAALQRGKELRGRRKWPRGVNKALKML